MKSFFKKRLNKPTKKLVMSAVLFLLVIIFFSLLALHIQAESIGTDLGASKGKIVGTAIGSYNGITEGLGSGRADGITAGLSAEDTKVEIKLAMNTQAKLEVLSLEYTMGDVNAIAKYDYYALIVGTGMGYYSVDLEKAVIDVSKLDDEVITVTLPLPEVDLKLDDDSWTTKAEIGPRNYIRSESWESSKTIGYMNTRKNIENSILRELRTNVALNEAAKDSTVTQVTNLIQSICGSKYEIIVQFSREV